MTLPELPFGRYSAGRGVPNLKKRDMSKVSHIILHTPGPGPERRSKKLGLDLVDSAVWIYRNVMDPCAHFVTGVEKIVQTCPLELKAQHVSSTAILNGKSLKATTLYRPQSLGANMPDWWKKTLESDPNLYTCMQDALRTGSYNEVSIGIEMAEIDKETVVSVATALKFRVPSLVWVTHHAAMNPLARTDKFGQYDLKRAVQDIHFGVGRACLKI